MVQRWDYIHIYPLTPAVTKLVTIYWRLRFPSLKMCVPVMMIPPQTKEGSAVCFTRQESTNVSLRTAGVSRRHSADGTISSRSGSTPRGGSVGRYHPYHRQCSDGEAPGLGGLQQGMSSFSCLQELCSPGTCSSSSRREASSSPSWDQYNGSIQVSYAVLILPSRFIPVYGIRNVTGEVYKERGVSKQGGQIFWKDVHAALLNRRSNINAHFKAVCLYNNVWHDCGIMWKGIWSFLLYRSYITLLFGSVSLIS